MARMKADIMTQGIRTTVDAVLVVYEHKHPHVLLLTMGNTLWKLPGGRVRPNENAAEFECLKRKLTRYLRDDSEALVPDWKVGECIATWWRPTLEPTMYPYCPPHITKPKECKRLYIVHLSAKDYFALPKNFGVEVVPLFELNNNVDQKYGPVLAGIPHQLSRFRFNLIATQEQ